MSNLTFGVNVANTLKSTERKSKFVKIAADETLRLRFLPPTNASGSLFTLQASHFQMKEDDKHVSPACNDEHGDGGCYLCKLSYFLQDHGDKAEQKIGKDIRKSQNWYAVVSVASKNAEGELEYAPPKLMRFSKTGADAVNQILVAQQAADDDFFCAPEGGQDIMFSRKGTGLQTKYSALPSGQKANLDDIMPGWESRLITDVWGELDPRMKTNDEMRALATGTFPDEIDWDRVEEHVG